MGLASFFGHLADEYRAFRDSYFSKDHLLSRADVIFDTYVGDYDIPFVPNWLERVVVDPGAKKITLWVVGMAYDATTKRLADGAEVPAWPAIPGHVLTDPTADEGVTPCDG